MSYICLLCCILHHKYAYNIMVTRYTSIMSYFCKGFYAVCFIMNHAFKNNGTMIMSQICTFSKSYIMNHAYKTNGYTGIMPYIYKSFYAVSHIMNHTYKTNRHSGIMSHTLYLLVFLYCILHHKRCIQNKWSHWYNVIYL